MKVTVQPSGKNRSLAWKITHPSPSVRLPLHHLMPTSHHHLGSPHGTCYIHSSAGPPYAQLSTWNTVRNQPLHSFPNHQLILNN